MSNEETEIINEVAAMPLAKVPSGQVAPAETKPQITPAQAKVEAVASLTMQAYQRAATLALTSEESAALSADFPDEAFQPGAAGKEHLIYIEHAHLRDRFTQVFGMGQWAIIPRNRWNEPFRTQRGTDGERVYVEAMLVVRGCFVGEAVGAMEYYPKNESQNYGDAVEGAKTAAFRRCAKEFGVGLQAWKKEWCEGWWQRRRGKTRQNAPGRIETTPPLSQYPPKAENAAPKATQAPLSQKPASTTPKTATEATREWMIKELKAGKGGPGEQIVTEYFVKLGQILETESLDDLPLHFVPVTKGELALLAAKIAQFEAGDEAVIAFPAHRESALPKPIEVPREPEPVKEGDEWRTFPMPFGKHAGTPMEELDKKYLYGLWANYTVETEYNGKPKREEVIAKDELFREMLDQAGEHYEFTKKD